MHIWYCLGNQKRLAFMYHCYVPECLVQREQPSPTLIFEYTRRESEQAERTKLNPDPAAMMKGDWKVLEV
jgi:hypothetical protein